MHFLSQLVSAEHDQRSALIKTMNEEQFKVLVECFYNVLHGVVTLIPQHKKKLSNYKNAIGQITKQGLTRLRRKKNFS